MAINQPKSLKELSKQELLQQLENANLTIGLLRQSLDDLKKRHHMLLDERDWLRGKFIVRLMGWLDGPNN